MNVAIWIIGKHQYRWALLCPIYWWWWISIGNAMERCNSIESDFLVLWFLYEFWCSFYLFFLGKKLIISYTYFLQYSEYLRRKFTFQKWKRWKHNVIFCLWLMVIYGIFIQFREILLIEKCFWKVFKRKLILYKEIYLKRWDKFCWKMISYSFFMRRENKLVFSL